MAPKYLNEFFTFVYAAVTAINFLDIMVAQKSGDQQKDCFLIPKRDLHFFGPLSNITWNVLASVVARQRKVFSLRIACLVHYL